MGAMTASQRRHPRRLRRRDPRRLPLAGRRRGRLLRARLRGGRRGAAAVRRRRRRARRLRAHRPRAQGPADRARPRGLGGPVRAGDRRGRGGRAWAAKRRRRPRPRVLGQPRAGLRLLAAALGLHLELEVGSGPLRGRHRRRRRDRHNLCVRAFARCTRPTPSTCARTSRSRRARHERGGLRGRAARGRLVSGRRRRARARHGARGPSRQRGRGAARRDRPVRRRRAGAPRPAGGPRGVLVVPHPPCPLRWRAPPCRPRCRWPTRSSTSPTRPCSCSGSPGGASTRWPAASPTASTSRAARRSTRLDGPRRGRAELGALGATISGAGPTVLVWSVYEHGGARRAPAGADRRPGRRPLHRRSSRRAPTCGRSPDQPPSPPPGSPRASFGAGSVDSRPGGAGRLQRGAGKAGQRGVLTRGVMVCLGLRCALPRPATSARHWRAGSAVGRAAHPRARPRRRLGRRGDRLRHDRRVDVAACPVPRCTRPSLTRWPSRASA